MYIVGQPGQPSGGNGTSGIGTNTGLGGGLGLGSTVNRFQFPVSGTQQPGSTGKTINLLINNIQCTCMYSTTYIYMYVFIKVSLWFHFIVHCINSEIWQPSYLLV